MPVKAKDLASDQSHLHFTEVQSVEAMLHDPNANHETVVQFLAPKSYAAKSELDERKNKQHRGKLWLESINQRQVELRLNHLKLQEMVKNSRKPTSGSGVGV